MRRTRALLAVVAVLALACSGGERPLPAAAPPPPPPASPRPGAKAEASWRKERYIPVRRAVARLQRHVDVPVVLPRDRSAGIPNYRGWLADPKYLDWSVVRGRRVGGLTLRTRNRILIISYGASSFDGCGGRESAVAVEVNGQPALLYQAPEHVWSAVLWPVTPRGSTGRYGLTGTFEGAQILRLAESMDTRLQRAFDVRRGC